MLHAVALSNLCASIHSTWMWTRQRAREAVVSNQWIWDSNFRLRCQEENWARYLIMNYYFSWLQQTEKRAFTVRLLMRRRSMLAITTMKIECSRIDRPAKHFRSRSTKDIKRSTTTRCTRVTQVRTTKKQATSQPYLPREKSRASLAGLPFENTETTQSLICKLINLRRQLGAKEHYHDLALLFEKDVRPSKINDRTQPRAKLVFRPHYVSYLSTKLLSDFKPTMRQRR